MESSDSSCTTSAFGDKLWYQNGELHRVDGPAVEHVNGNKYLYLNGKLHRPDGPAIECGKGKKQWWLNGWYCKPIEVFKAATHEQQIHMLCFYASEFMP